MLALPDDDGEPISFCRFMEAGIWNEEHERDEGGKQHACGVESRSRSCQNYQMMIGSPQLSAASERLNME